MKESFKVCFCCVRSFKVKSSEPPEEIKNLFHDYSQDDRMSADEMLRFVIQVQGETHADINYVKDIFHRLKHHGVFHPRGIHLEGFYRYLLSDFNSPLPVTSEVWQDMNQPLSHYFLYTGHNSYLTGNQLNSNSSIEPIVKALRKGVRVIELDLWPNSSGKEAEVRHGGTLTSCEDLQKCLNAVKENAFQVSAYPVVLTLEDHLTPNLQKKVAKMVSKTFGGSLFQCTDEYTECFPSPESLKNKILISTKPPKEYLQTQVSQGSTTDESIKAKKIADAEEQVQEEDEESVAIEYRDLISIHAGNRKGGLKNCLNGDPNRVIRLSMSEQWLETLAKTRGSDLVKFTQRNLLRIFPKTTRFDSSNYDPLVGWIHGAQMVAFNMQSHGRYLWMMQGMFKANGGCGYVKKPDVLLSNGPGGEIFDPCSQKLPIKTTLKVKIYTGEGWNMDFPLDHFDRYSPPDFYAKARVGIAGVPLDTASYRTEIDTDEWFPIWDKEFEFPLRVPELAILCITVKDYDSNTQNDFAGQTCLPLSEVRPGIRAVRLHDRAGEVYKHVRLLMRFVLEPR
ncbi:ATPLC1 [Arabidopsis lyrata subsp. lyrata]|uniref:Phosphoinositide phospholipase C n=1 Tax=Arabidopsis lyrata subsp. lyrata TaxID=81972 RepID=D7MQG3_ARALL|nr:ATPLC1 [Arabidopsis lyrata subsp. lyrata]